jgi:hypothetical protein
MKKRWTAHLLIALLAATSPELLLLAYSQTLTGVGIGAIDFWWQYDVFDETTLNVSSANSVAIKTIVAEQLSIHCFNTNGNIVSILVISGQGGTILNHSRVSGTELPGITYPLESPTGWVESQKFNVIVCWEGVNASVYFMYYTSYVGHADGSVRHTLPGFEMAQSLGFLALGSGLTLFTVIATIHVKRFGIRNST